MSVPDEATKTHWLWNGDAGWECTGCDWAGDKLDDFYAVHERPTDDIPF